MALAFIVLLLLFAPVVVSQPGFLSIDCGLDDNYSGYTDKITGIYYVSDGPYINAGENRRIAPDLESLWSYRQQTLRSFPSGMRNYYSLPTVAGTKYLVRATTAYGNYDGKNSSSLEFDLHLGANYWKTAYPDATTSFVVHEAIFVAWAGWAPVCLVNTGRGTPFVSALELRSLGNALYPLVAPGLIISTYARENMGASVSTIRSPSGTTNDRMDHQDTFMKFSPRWVNESTIRPIQPDTSFAVPSSILQTAVAAAGNDTALTATTWQDYTKSRSFMMFLHFADFQETQLRQFDIYINQNKSGQELKLYKPWYLTPSSVHSESYRDTDGTYNITLAASATSALPPMINALEIYIRIPCESPTTLPKDCKPGLCLPSQSQNKPSI